MRPLAGQMTSDRSNQLRNRLEHAPAAPELVLEYEQEDDHEADVEGG